MPLSTTRTSSKPQADAMRRHACDAARLLKAIGNENRLLVLCALAEGERSVGELQQQLDLSQSALSQHLAVLRREGLVSTRREAQSIYYSLADDMTGKLIGFLYENFCAA